MSRFAKKIYKIVNETMFPTKCLACGSFFIAPEFAENGLSDADVPGLTILACVERLFAKYLCQGCIKGLIVVESPLCSCCGIPFVSRQGLDHTCGDCITSPKTFRMARAPLVFKHVIMEVIHCYKYKGKIQLARPLGELLFWAFRLLWDKDRVDVVTPVPLHAKKFRQRGFNQAYLLLKSWTTIAKQMQIDPGNLQIERDILSRTVPTAPQTGLDRRQRAANIKNAFELADKSKIIDKRILLVDDVYTTGATVDECARLLLHHGAGHVDVLSLARAI
jgi:ComF family protein